MEKNILFQYQIIKKVLQINKTVYQTHYVSHHMDQSHIHIQYRHSNPKFEMNLLLKKIFKISNITKL